MQMQMIIKIHEGKNDLVKVVDQRAVNDNHEGMK